MAFGNLDPRGSARKPTSRSIDFARDINISPAYWSRIERGLEKAPKDQLIISACERLAWEPTGASIEARRLPADMQDDISVAVSVYGNSRPTPAELLNQ
jgi:hypothetical protein